MAPAIVHFLVGASILLVLAAPVALRYDLGDRWPVWLVLVGGLWGLLPDVHHVAPVYEAQLIAFHDSRWADLFAFHYTLDLPVVRDHYHESIFAAIVLFVGAVGVFTLAAGLRDERGGLPPIASAPRLSIVAGIGTVGVAVVLATLLRAAL